MRSIVLIAHNLRSTHNVGALLRTADGLGVKKVILTGYTPYPTISADTRLPHISQKQTKQIRKTALGAEASISIEHSESINEVIVQLHNNDYIVYALEQNPNSVSLPSFKPPDQIAILVGREVEGIEQDVLDLVDGILEIPMQGQKESFNVAQAAAMALYHVVFFT